MIFLLNCFIAKSILKSFTHICFNWIPSQVQDTIEHLHGWKGKENSASLLHSYLPVTCQKTTLYFWTRGTEMRSKPHQSHSSLLHARVVLVPTYRTHSYTCSFKLDTYNNTSAIMAWATTFRKQEGHQNIFSTTKGAAVHLCCSLQLYHSARTVLSCYLWLWLPMSPSSKESTLVLLPEKSHGQRSLVGYSPWGCKESNATAYTHIHPWLYDSSYPQMSSNYFLVYKIVECVLACVYVVSPHRLRKFVKSFHCMLNQKMTTVIKLNVS